MEIDVLQIEENINQNQFPEYIEKKGYKCIRLILKNFESVEKILGCTFEKGIGLPDFLIYNSNEKLFCDFKSKNDSWAISQMEWALRNTHIKLVLAVVSNHKTPSLYFYVNKNKEEYKTARISKKTYKELCKLGTMGQTVGEVIAGLM